MAPLTNTAGKKYAQGQPETMNEYPNWQMPLAGSGGKSLKLEGPFTADLLRRVADVMSGDRQNSWSIPGSGPRWSSPGSIPGGRYP